MRIVTVVGFGLILTSFLLVSSPTLAQDSASIAGAVTDETGGFLPGVTVEVQGPSILAPRTAVTDSAGIFTVTNLPSGTYTVTFELAGFNTMVREDVVLQGAFTASIDMTLPVGELSESVTVTSAAPLVDIISTRQQSVLVAERVNVLPGAANLYRAAAYVPGVTFTGPSSGLTEGGNPSLPALHGSDANDGQPAVDGIRTGAQLQARGEWPAGIGLVTNEAMVTEVVFDTASQNAEYPQSGMRTNVIPKSGGNNYSFNVFGTGTRSAFQSDNQSQALKDQGFQFAPVDSKWSINPAVGGPIVENKLWFFGSFVESRQNAFILDRFFDLDEPSTPDSVTADDLRAFSKEARGQQSLRLTYQVTPRNKVTFLWMSLQNETDRVGVQFGGITNPEAFYYIDSNPTRMLVGRWTAPLTSRMLFEVDASYQKNSVNTNPMAHGEARHQVRDSVLGTHTMSTFQNHHNLDFHRRFNASASYVTGSHNFKAGLQVANNRTDLKYSAPGEIFAVLKANGTAVGALVVGNGESQHGIKMNCDCGIYVQDAWTRDRLTLNGGFRYDWFKNSVPGGTRPAGFWAPEVTVPDPVVENVPNFKNYSGRLGGAYDLFGDGSTAVKASVGRYVAYEGTGLTQGFSPIYPYNLIDFRIWTDLNGDGVALTPDTGIPQFDEVGPSFNPNYGTSTITTEYDESMRRGTNIEYAAGVERQLGPGWAISGMWHHRSYSNFNWRDNLNNSAADYVLAGTFTGPSDPDLPTSARNAQIPIFNVREGRVITGGNNYLTNTTENWRTWNGFEVILDGELPRGGFMTGSFTMGQNKEHFCQGGIFENPNDFRHCEVTSPYRPMGKLSGGLPLPWDTMISGLFQVFAGAPIRATYTITTTDFPDLDLGPGQAPTLPSRNLIEPFTEFEEYSTDLLLRFSKVFTISDVRTRLYMDASNIFNSARVTSRNRFYGGDGVKNPDFLRILGIEPGRALSFGFQMYF